MPGWAKIVSAAAYCDVSPRTLREWLKQGLEHSRLPSGHILIRYSALDEFLKKYQACENQAEQIADTFFSKGFRNRKGKVI